MQGTGSLGRIFLYCSAGLGAKTGCKGRLVATVGWWGRDKRKRLIYHTVGGRRRRQNVTCLPNHGCCPGHEGLRLWYGSCY